MTDHYRKAVESLEEAADLRTALDRAHEARASASTIASLYDRIRFVQQTARVHADLAIAQAIHDQGVLMR